ncbi:hypothetical protein SK128_021420 [Halocaridina rubra]|uniref:Uncharacterized protein n=1 Tax=Halocaridina rubra TaxID=373956 RepID=A0AAN9A922_HALRR
MFSDFRIKRGVYNWPYAYASWEFPWEKKPENQRQQKKEKAVAEILNLFPSLPPGTAATTAPCMGRKLRRMRKPIISMESSDEPTKLEASQAAEEESDIEMKDLQEQERFFFTLWSTLSTTVTVTTFSTNRSITISALMLCSNAVISPTVNFC